MTTTTNTRKAAVAEMRGAARAAHFANGGSLQAWRRSGRTFADRKRAASREACRGGRWAE